MSLIGRRIGSFTIHSLLGAGGMGEVYRAHDSSLGRDVAIKILPAVWLIDEERRARFDREARTLASLNHPHIGAIYGVEEYAVSDSGTLVSVPGHAAHFERRLVWVHRDGTGRCLTAAVRREGRHRRASEVVDPQRLRGTLNADGRETAIRRDGWIRVRHWRRTSLLDSRGC
jgi:hypothetical protein